VLQRHSWMALHGSMHLALTAAVYFAIEWSSTTEQQIPASFLVRSLAAGRGGREDG